LKFTHGRGKYTRRAILESTVTDVRYLSCSHPYSFQAKDLVGVV